MHGPTVALYWDPLIHNNGLYYEQQHFSNGAATATSNGSLNGSLNGSVNGSVNGPANGPANGAHVSSTSSSPFKSSFNDNHDFLKPASPTDTSESITTRNNIAQLLTKYSIVYAYSNPADFIHHLYDIGDRHVFDSSIQSETNPFLRNPILLVMVPTSSPQQYAIVRFFAFIAFTIPSICVVLTDPKRRPSCYSFGVYDILPLTIDADIFKTIEIKSNLLSQHLVKDCIKHQQQLQHLTQSRKECDNHRDAVSGSTTKELSFKKSSQHIHHFFSALEYLHKVQTAGTHYELFLRAASLAHTTEIPQSSHPQVFNLSPGQIGKVEDLIGDWNFYAHELNNDELLFAGYAMIKHGFTLPNVTNLQISDVALLRFLLVVRDSYRPSNPYHNFRHAIDVLQAAFYFLLRLGSLPTYPPVEDFDPAALSTLLTPIEVLTILIVAMGHDVGHPGVTNMFLASSQAPLAKVFNYNSVLESYHSAAFTEILKCYWPETQQVPVCKLIVQSVLATDMARHFDYMNEVARFAAEENLPRDEQYRMLVCCLLIKCADISNVARRLDISARWGLVLSKEFAEGETLELALGLKDPPATTGLNKNGKVFEAQNYIFDNRSQIPRSKLAALAPGQIHFIKTFAKPLFTAVSELLPQLDYTLAILDENENTWLAGQF
ncbi:hypothetical protein D0Z00_000685 [Geotrichum galactomycetum]|uniref:Uncharacterized protein n=1 Tax=Geotrichum galactomycetum TaxID=27317 RepID=A0ACB6V951_9ASCO|nr:hypothetical protein D0Z00_000685 [Geotrichum candidum]